MGTRDIPIEARTDVWWMNARPARDQDAAVDSLLKMKAECERAFGRRPADEQQERKP